MPSITIDIGIEGPRVLNALAEIFGYQSTIPNGEGQVPNPETKAIFVKRHIAKMLKDMVVAHEANQAAEAARNVARTGADGLVIS